MSFLRSFKSRNTRSSKPTKPSSSSSRPPALTPATAPRPMTRASTLPANLPSLADGDPNYSDTEATESETPENELPRRRYPSKQQSTISVPTVQGFPNPIINPLPTIWDSLNTGLAEQDAGSFEAFPAEVIDLPAGHEGMFRHALDVLCEALQSIPRAVGSFRAFVLCPRCRIPFHVSFSILVDVPIQEPRRNNQGELAYQGPLGGIYCSTCGKVRPEA